MVGAPAALPGDIAKAIEASTRRPEGHRAGFGTDQELWIVPTLSAVSLPLFIPRMKSLVVASH